MIGQMQKITSLGTVHIFTKSVLMDYLYYLV